MCGGEVGVNVVGSVIMILSIVWIFGVSIRTVDMHFDDDIDLEKQNRLTSCWDI